MKLRTPLVAVTLMVVAAALIFALLQRQLSSASFAFGTHPEVLDALELSLGDLKRLAELDPDNKAEYRTRFDELATMNNRLQILEHNREDLVRRYETILLVIFALSVVVVTGIYTVRQGRNETRLARLQGALTGLAEGRTDIEVGDFGRDTIGRIASMVEQTSKLMARDRRRLATLRNLSSWQEAARRHAHEIRTPLTGAKLELTRISKLLESQSFPGRDEISQATRGAQQEIDRLSLFTKQFHSFAKLPEPQLSRQDLGALLGEMVSIYGAAWPNLSLELEAVPGVDCMVDRDLIRQVLVNLCDNSSHALAETQGVLRIELTGTNSEAIIDVSDNGPGISEEARQRLFEPYFTTKNLGEGVGLGLPISKKILLDHSGDLELLGSDSACTTFRLTLQKASPLEVDA